MSIQSHKAQALVKQMKTKARFNNNHSTTCSGLLEIIRDIQHSRDMLTLMRTAIAKDTFDNSSTDDIIL